MAIVKFDLLEQRRNTLNKILTEYGSPNSQLIELTNYLSDLLTFDNGSILNAYFSEFLPKYFSLLKTFSPFGIEPSITESIYSTAEKFLIYSCPENAKSELSFSIAKIENKFNELRKILDGGNSENTKGNNLQFPILEKSDDDRYIYGFLETITISISKRSSLSKDTFIIIPDFGKTDDRLNHQIQDSWNFAIKYFANSIKSTKQFHEVVIRFNKKYGIYEGNSLGIVLTIGFIQELIRFYNLRDVVKLGSNIASTGSVNKNGKNDSVGAVCIHKKVDTVFYSDIQKFIIPSSDLTSANKRLEELKKKYPNRVLEIIGVSSVNDLVDRRSLVSIKKQNIVKWAAKKTYNNKLAVAAILLLIIVSSYFFVKDFDDNPVDFIYKNGTAYAVNNYGKILWDIAPVPFQPQLSAYTDYYKKYYKIDKKGSSENDIYICGVNPFRGLYKLDFNGNPIWSFNFIGDIESDSEKFSNIFNVNQIVGIIDRDDIKEVVAIAQHYNYYPNAVMKINSETGSLNDSIFWHPGGIIGAFIEDVDSDGKLEFGGLAISNGYNCMAFFGIEYDKLEGTAPAPKGYRFQNKKIADFEWYILLPLTDYGKHHYPKYNTAVEPPKYKKKNGHYAVSTVESGLISRKKPESILYIFDKNFNRAEVIIDDSFATDRDKLVDAGVLQKPYSDTREYREIIKSQILIWNRKEFVQMFPDSVTKN